MIVLDKRVVGHAVREIQLVLLQLQNCIDLERSRLARLVLEIERFWWVVADLEDDADFGQSEIVARLDLQVNFRGWRDLDLLLRFHEANDRLAVGLDLDVEFDAIQVHTVRGLGEKFVIKALVDRGQFAHQLLALDSQGERGSRPGRLLPLVRRKEAHVSRLRRAVERETELNLGSFDDL